MMTDAEHDQMWRGAQQGFQKDMEAAREAGRRWMQDNPGKEIPNDMKVNGIRVRSALKLD